MDTQGRYNSVQRTDEKVRTTARKTVDYFTPMGKYIIHKSHTRKKQSIGKIRPEVSYMNNMLIPQSSNQPQIDMVTKFAHASTNKSKHAIHAIKWTPDGKRILVASHAGEFTIWNGFTFNFESIMQAHDSSILSLNYSKNGDWLISGDQSGYIKFWQPNFNNVNIISPAHDNAIQDLKFSPNDSKFVSCSDDQTLKIWNFNNGKEERVLKGHHWDVKSCDWHDSLGLIVSGSKDNLMKFWDPRMGKCITTLHDFKHTIIKTRFQNIGNQRLLAACSRDHSTRIFDIRTMKPLSIIKTTDESDLSSIVWHPVYPSVFTIGGYNGSISTYDLDKYLPPEQFTSSSSSLSSALKSDHTLLSQNQSQSQQYESYRLLHKIPYAHEKAIFTMEYHPLGHILGSAGADRMLRVWSRSKAGDPEQFKDFAYTGINDNPTGYYNNNNASANANANTSVAPTVVDTNANTNTNANIVVNEKSDENASRPVIPGFSIPGLSF